MTASNHEGRTTEQTLPVNPRTKREYEQYLNLCREWAQELDDPAPFDEWEQQLAREMDRKCAGHGVGRHE